MKNYNILLFSKNYGIANRNLMNDEMIFKILNKALQNKIYDWDTATNYGDSETYLSNFGKHNEEGIRTISITSKINFSNEFWNYEDMRLKITGIINRIAPLKLKEILFHNVDDLNKCIDNLNEIIFTIKKEFNIKIGVSIYTTGDYELIRGFNGFDVLQIPFSLLNQSFLRINLFKKLKTKY